MSFVLEKSFDGFESREGGIVGYVVLRWKASQAL